MIALKKKWFWVLSLFLINLYGMDERHQLLFPKKSRPIVDYNEKNDRQKKQEIHTLNDLRDALAVRKISDKPNVHITVNNYK